MSDKHQVIDADKHFVIDPITRTVNNESGKLVLMQNDHDSERFTFEIPRYVEGHDMSLCNVVQIHYNNIDSSRRYQNSDIYVVDDLAITAGEDGSEDTVTGSWLISMNATEFAGSLEFIVRFACVQKDGTIDYQWFSNVYSMVQVIRGIYNVDVVTNFDDKDILTAWKREILEETLPQVVDLVREAEETLTQLSQKTAGTYFSVNFETGNLEYTSPNYTFSINRETGNLEWEVAA